jgi:hypothetical protein
MIEEIDALKNIKKGRKRKSAIVSKLQLSHSKLVQMHTKIYTGCF